VALIVGAAFGWFLVTSVKKTRVALLKASQRSGVQKLSGNFVVKLLARLLFGKPKVGLADEMQQKHPLIRKSGVAFAVAVAAIAIVVELLVLDRVFRSAIEDGIGAAVGAEVNVSKASLSISDGKMHIEGLQITDPDAPDFNMIQAEALVGDLSMRDLLAKRFVIDELRVSAVNTNVPRSSRGVVYVKPEPETPSEPQAESLEWYLQQTEDLKKYKKYVEKVLDYLEKQRLEREQQKDYLEELARKRSYFKRSARDILAKRPAWTIRKLTVDKLTFGESPSTYAVESTELSSSPALNPAPMTVKVTQSDGFLADVQFNFAQASAPHSIKLFAPALPIGDALKLSDNSPIDVSGGSIAATLEGTFSADQLNLPLVLVVKDLQANSTGKVLGLDPGTANEIFKNVTNFAVSGLVHGPATSPRIAIDERKLLANLKESLLAAGKAELANRANAELVKLQGKLEETIGKEAREKLDELEKKLPTGVTDVLKDNVPSGLPLDKLPVKLPGVLGLPAPKNDKEQEAETKAPEDKPLDKIKGILGR